MLIRRAIAAALTIAAAVPIAAGSAAPAHASRVDVLVRLGAPADLRAAQNLDDWRARGAAVVDALHERYARDRAALGHALDGLTTTPLWAIDAVVVHDADANVVARLARNSKVSGVSLDTQVRLAATTAPVPATITPNPAWGVAQIGAPAVWSRGIDGHGVVVANIDTGVEATHPALAAQYRRAPSGAANANDWAWYDPTNTCATAPCDNIGHGTHTMGTMVGGDGSGTGTDDIGVAPGARWIAAKGCITNSCDTTQLLLAAQWMLAPTRIDGSGADPAKRPNIVNASWYTPGGNPFFRPMVDAWNAAGIVGVFATGNVGPACGSVGSPADYPESFSVGSTDSTDSIMYGSGRGPSQFGNTAPSVVAPGVAVNSAWTGGTYRLLSGTSMAAPHAAGALALAMQANPAFVAHPELAIAALRTSAHAHADTTCAGTAADNDVYGAGRIDAAAAVDQALDTSVVGVPWSTGDAQRLAEVAAYLGTTPERLQHDAVAFLAFLVALSGDSAPTPWSPTPRTNDTVVASAWASTDLPLLQTAQDKYAVDTVDAHRLGTYFVEYLVALGGH